MTSVRRRSAFVIFRAIKPLLSAGKLLTGNKLVKNESNLSKSLLDAGNSQQFMADSSDMIDAQNVSPDASTSKSTARVRNTATTATVNNSSIATATATATANAHSNGQSSQRNAKIVQQTARKPFKSCDSKKLTRSNRDKMLQEKEDFQLAKMLQECIGTSDTTSRYSLRSRFRNKSSVSSSLSSSASSTDLFQLKYGGGNANGVCTIATSKYKKSSLPFPDSSSSNTSTNDLITTPITTRTSASSAFSATGQRNNLNDNSNDKFMEFSFQKLTRSRRIAMTMSGV